MIFLDYLWECTKTFFFTKPQPNVALDKSYIYLFLYSFNNLFLVPKQIRAVRPPGYAGLYGLAFCTVPAVNPGLEELQWSKCSIDKRT